MQISILMGSILIFLGVLFILISAIPDEAKDDPDRSGTSAQLTLSRAFMDEKPSPTCTVGPVETLDPPSAANSICSQAWGIELPASLPAWLSTPQDASGLYTEIKYVLLAGKLIQAGIVSAGDCQDGGLTIDGTANPCGLERAFPQVVLWQNQFDQEIFVAALDNQMPAQVIKRLFAQETQFWPPDTLAPASYGIGNVTSPGVEPLFLWYDDIYQNTCAQVFSQPCSQPYHSLSLQDQQLLRGYFISHTLHVYCPTCAYGIDLEKVRSSIDYFAKLIIANCHQIDLILGNHGYSTQALSYEDAWRLTLANYTVGAGCVNNALENVDLAEGFTWENFTSQLSPDCSVEIYINRITGK